MARAAAQRARRHPAATTPGAKASDRLAWAEAVENDFIVGARALREEAQTVYLGIRRSGKLPGGVDRLLAARRQRKSALKAAEMADAAAKMMHTFRSTWLGTFGEPNSAAAQRRHGIDFTA